MESMNHTTPHVSPSVNTKDLQGYYALIPFVLITVLGCALAVAIYFKRRYRSDELRHRLIPMYSYDPAEQDEYDLEYSNRDDD